MPHHLNNNKQFMIGNGILAFAVIFVVVIFVYMSMRLQQQKRAERKFIETYTVVLESGFIGDSISLSINDSLILSARITQQPLRIEAPRTAEHSALMVVDHATDLLSIIELDEDGGIYKLEKEGNEVKQIVK